MSIRPEALEWLRSKFKVVSGAIYTSKLYAPEHSWTGRQAWWVEIPENAIEAVGPTKIHIVQRMTY